MKVQDLRNQVPINQLLDDLDKGNAHVGLDYTNFNQLVRTNYGSMTVEQIRNVFKAYDSGLFKADVEDAINFNERFSRIMRGHQLYKIEQAKQVNATVDVDLSKLLKEQWNLSVMKGKPQFRMDVAVYGYNVLKQRGSIANVDIEMTSEFGTLEKAFLKERHDNGASMYNLGNDINMNQYKNHVRQTIFENYFLKEINKK